MKKVNRIKDANEKMTNQQGNDQSFHLLSHESEFSVARSNALQGSYQKKRGRSTTIKVMEGNDRTEASLGTNGESNS